MPDTTDQTAWVGAIAVAGGLFEALRRAVGAGRKVEALGAAQAAFEVSVAKNNATYEHVDKVEDRLGKAVREAEGRISARLDRIEAALTGRHGAGE